MWILFLMFWRRLTVGLAGRKSGIQPCVLVESLAGHSLWNGLNWCMCQLSSHHGSLCHWRAKNEAPRTKFGQWTGDCVCRLSRAKVHEKSWEVFSAKPIVLVRPRNAWQFPDFLSGDVLSLAQLGWAVLQGPIQRSQSLYGGGATSSCCSGVSFRCCTTPWTFNALRHWGHRWHRYLMNSSCMVTKCHRHSCKYVHTLHIPHLRHILTCSWHRKATSRLWRSMVRSMVLAHMKPCVVIQRDSNTCWNTFISLLQQQMPTLTSPMWKYVWLYIIYIIYIPNTQTMKVQPTTSDHKMHRTAIVSWHAELFPSPAAPVPNWENWQRWETLGGQHQNRKPPQVPQLMTSHTYWSCRTCSLWCFTISSVFLLDVSCNMCYI